MPKEASAQLRYIVASSSILMQDFADKSRVLEEPVT